MPSIVEEARRLVANGWKVFPLQPRTKEPLPGSNGWHGASTDPSPWDRHPDYNIGLPMALNGLVALDVDGTWGQEKLAELEQRYGKLPPTRTHRHGDGFHLVYRLPTGVTLKTTTLAKDIRTDDNGDPVHSEVRLIANGYLVAPPSIHPDGELYDLDDADMPTLLPGWIDATEQERRRQEADRDLHRQATPRILDRPGDDYNAHVSCHEILEQHGWARGKTDRKGTAYTRPGKTRGTSAVVYHDNGKAHIYSSSTNLPDGQQYDPYGLLARLDFNSDFTATTRHLIALGYGNPHMPLPPIEIAAGEPNNTDNLHDLLIDWNKFWTRNHEEQQWLCDPIIPAGRSISIYAPGGTGKSLLTLWIAACLATGKPILNHTGPPIHVLYVDYEMTEADLMERLENMGFGPDTDWTHLHYALLPAIAPLDDPAGATTLVRLAQLVNAELVIIDTFARAVKGDENEADTVRNFYRLTGQAMKAAGIAMVRIDHAGKDTTRGARGTSAKRDDVDIVWNLTALEQGTLQLKAEKRRVSWVPETVKLLQHGTEDDQLHWRLAPESQTTYAAGTATVATLLDQLDIPLDAGARPVGKALREAGHKVGNQALRDALKWRRERAKSLLARATTSEPGAS